MRLALRALFFACLVSTFCEHSQAETRTASGTVTSYSLSLGPVNGYNTGGYSFTSYFSTYDGITNADPQGFYNSQLSGELMPSTPGSGSYITDFTAYNRSYGVYYSRGTMTLTLPTTDSDSNGCPDALQVNKSFSSTGSATSIQYVSQNGGFTWSYYGIETASFSFSRNAGSAAGTVSGSEYDSTSGTTSTYTGSYKVQGGTGNATYNTTTKGIIFAGNSFSFNTSGTGTSTYTRISDTQVSVAQFDFYTSDGDTRTVKAFTLNRAGNYYRAYPVELVDGDPSTSFIDFRYCHVEIYDTNDSDSDGIPDLSDNVYNSAPVAPSALISGLRADLGQSFTYTPVFENSPTSYSATDLPPGISVNSVSGTISGTPTAAGYYYGLLTAYNSSGSASLDIPITIPGALQSIPFSDNFSAAVANRYLPFNVYSPASMEVKNGVALFDSPTDGENSATAGFVLNLPLPLASSWDIAADVNLPNGWETTEAEIGLSLEPMFGPSDTLETHSIRGDYLSLMLNRDTQPSEEGANNISRSVYVGNVDQEDLEEVLVDDSLVTARLRLVYLSGSKTLTAWVQTNPNTGWVRLGSPLDFNPGNANSLAQRWSLSSGSSLMLVLYGYAEGGTGGRMISLDNLSITAFTPPTITSPLTFPGTVAGSFSYQTTATGNPTTFNLSGTLPTGLAFNSSTGRITGIPTQSGTFTVSLSATSGSYTGPSVSLRITIPALVGSYTSGYAASSQFSASHPVAKAFDNNANTMWHSAAASFPHTIARDFGSPATIASISLNNGHFNGQNYATSLQVLGSNDNLVWTTLGTFPNLILGLNTLSLSSPQTYRYFALKATAGSHPSYWGVKEIVIEPPRG